MFYQSCFAIGTRFFLSPVEIILQHTHSIATTCPFLNYWKDIVLTVSWQESNSKGRRVMLPNGSAGFIVDLEQSLLFLSLFSSLLKLVFSKDFTIPCFDFLGINFEHVCKSILVFFCHNDLFISLVNTLEWQQSTRIWCFYSWLWVNNSFCFSFWLQ